MASLPGTVPAEQGSSSDYGPSSVLPTSTEPELVIAEKIEDSATTMAATTTAASTTVAATAVEDEMSRSWKGELSKGHPVASPKYFKMVSDTLKIADEDNTSTTSSTSTSTTSTSSDMSVEGKIPSDRKRKAQDSICAANDSDDSDEDSNFSRVKVSRKQKILKDSESPKGSIRKNSPSNSNRSFGSNEESRSKGGGYFTRNKKKEMEKRLNTAEDYREFKDESLEGDKAFERMKREKAVARLQAEAKVIAEVGNEDYIEEELINAMTASDIAANALSFLEDMDVIRSKCKTIQGRLSGKLKNKKESLDNMVRALHKRAEAQGDPMFLRAKVDELIKKNRQEEERRKREISELRERIVNLAKENKEMRKELWQMKEDKVSQMTLRKRIPEKENEYSPERSNDDTRRPTMSHDVPRRPTSSRDVVMSNEEDPAEGRYVPIPEAYLKHIKKVNKEERVEAAIRIIDDRQLTPPKKVRKVGSGLESDRMETDEEDERKGKLALGKLALDLDKEGWKDRTKKKKEEKTRIEKTSIKKEESSKNMEDSGGDKVKKKRINSAVKERKRKIPKTAAVSIKGDTKKEGFSYAEVLRKARTGINMEDLQITSLRVRKALNGGVIIEISEENCQEKADKLANRIQEVLKEDAVDVRRPSVKGELRISGLDESITKEEIRWKIAEEGGCLTKEVKIGDIRKMRSGMGSVWAQCPLKAATEVANKAKLKIGWSIAGVTLLKARPIQCYRCWHLGHVSEQCKSTIDRRACCFRCGTKGHKIDKCQNEVRCAICSDMKKEYNHRVGSLKCEGIKCPPSTSGNPYQKEVPKSTSEHKVRNSEETTRMQE